MALIKAIIDWNNMIFNTELKRGLQVTGVWLGFRHGGASEDLRR